MFPPTYFPGDYYPPEYFPVGGAAGALRVVPTDLYGEWADDDGGVDPDFALWEGA